MNDLPPGFVLDPPPNAGQQSFGATLPAGFVLDNPAPDMDAAFQQFDNQPKQPALRDALDNVAFRRQNGDGMVMNATAGLNEGIYGTLGAPVDLATGAVNLGIRGVNALTGSDINTLGDLPGGSRSIARGFGAVGVPDPENVQTVGAGQQVARMAGQGAGYMVAPELAVRGGAKAIGAGVNPYMEALFGTSNSAGELAGNAVVGATAGGAGSVAGQVAPEPWKPVAEMAGNLIGGGVGAVAASGPRAAREGARMGQEYLAPLTEGGRERMASTALRDAASDPYAAREALDAPGQIVPGSQPTTFQQTGDMGLGGLERAVATNAPDQFMQRRAEQNSARTDAIGSFQKQGHPEAVVKALRQNLSDLDGLTAAALDTATTNARQGAAGLRGEGTPEGYGASMRQMLSDAETTVRERERGLWKAVDPDGTLALDAGDIRKSAIDTFKSQPKAAKPMEGEERAIFQAAAGFKGVMPFNEVAALRSRVSTEMRNELSQNGQTPVYARLTQLRGAIERQIETAVEGKAAQEAEAVASGAMREEDTMLSQWAAAMAAGKETWLADRAGRAGQEAVGYSGGLDVAGSRPVSGSYRSEGQGGRGLDNASGAEGIPGNAGLTPNFDEAARARLTEANDATKARAQTFGRGPVGDTLRRSGKEGPYNVPASTVPQKFFRPGPRGYEDVMAIRNAVNTPEAMSTVRDYAVSTLRRASERSDGTLDPVKVRAWREKHKDAMRAFPEIDGMLANPVKASETMETLAIERKQKLDTYQAGLVGRLIGVQDTADVTKMIGAVFSTEKPVQVMRRLTAETAKDPDAQIGLRKALADWIGTRFVSNTEAATSGQGLMRSDAFQQFIKQNEAALRVVFKPEEVATMKAIAADLQRSNRSVTAVKLPGQSNTAQDLAASSRANQQPSVLSRLLTLGGQLTAGTLATGSPMGGIAAALGGEAVSALRKAGIQKVDDLITDAMLNPDRARVLLQKMPEKLTPQQRISILQRYRRAALLLTDPVENERQPLRISVP